MALGEREEPGRECGEPAFVCGRQPERERGPARRRAHRREVGKVDRERLVAERARVRPGQEMAPFDQHVGGHRELEPRVGPQQRAVVADAEQRLLRRPVEEPADEFEFVQTRGLLLRRWSSG